MNGNRDQNPQLDYVVSWYLCLDQNDAGIYHKQMLDTEPVSVIHLSNYSVATEMYILAERGTVKQWANTEQRPWPSFFDSDEKGQQVTYTRQTS